MYISVSPLAYLKTSCLNITKFSVHDICCHGWVLLWQVCNKMQYVILYFYIFSIVDDVMFAHRWQESDICSKWLIRVAIGVESDFCNYLVNIWFFEVSTFNCMCCENELTIYGHFCLTQLKLTMYCITVLTAWYQIFFSLMWEGRRYAAVFGCCYFLILNVSIVVNTPVGFVWWT